MTEDRKTPTQEDPPRVEELTPDQIEQVVGGDANLGAGKVNVGDLAFPPTHRRG